MLVSLGRLILILCLIAQGTAIAQNRVIDSLKAVIAQQANDSNTIKAYIALSAEQLNFSYDSSVYNAEMAIELAKKQGDKRREADAFMRMGTAHNFKGEYELATSSYETALALFKEQALYLNMGKALNNLGFMYRNMADYPKSLDYFMQSLKIKEEHGTAADVGVAYQNIGIVFAIQNEIETAAEYIQKAVELFYKSGDSVKYYSVLIDLSSLYREQQKYEESSAVLQKALKYHRQNDDRVNMAICYYNLGVANYLNKKLEPALLNFGEAREIFTEVGNKVRIIGCNIQLANVYLDLGDVAQAEKMALDGVAVVDQTSSPVQEYNLYEVLSRIYSKSGDFRKAYEYHVKYNELKDSISHEEQRLKIVQLQDRFDKERSKRELAEFKAQSERRDRQNAIQNYVLIGLILISVLLMIMVYSRFKTKKKNNEALKEKNAIIQHSLDEKEVLLREIHHRVQNNLQFVSSMLNLQSRRVNDEYTLNVLKDCKLRIQSMAMIHQKLYQEDSLKGINILNYTQNLIESLMHSYQIDSSEVDVELDIEQLYLDINSAIPIGLILNELITNCFKYAFTEKIRARLVVTLKETEGGLHLTVEDNGPGLPSNFEVDGSDSFGLKLVKSLAAKLKAEIQMKSEHGAEVSVLIKEYEKVSNGI